MLPRNGHECYIKNKQTKEYYIYSKKTTRNKKEAFVFPSISNARRAVRYYACDLLMRNRDFEIVLK